ncbi:MAG TPA: hypothetical protein VES60_10460 [Nakamurella sp.]|nr:hypothetical protein [Nakamurella sp.]
MTATEGAPMARPGLAWTVLGVGVIAYVLTVMQRTSLGVAGLDAAQRFEVTPVRCLPSSSFRSRSASWRSSRPASSSTETARG